MKAVDYLKEKARMTNNCDTDYCVFKCPLNSKRNKTNTSCTIFEINYPKTAVEIVEKWAKENPVKTYLSVLSEKLPNAKLNIRGIPDVCIKHYFGKEYGNCGFESCVDCWNREYKEETNEI